MTKSNKETLRATLSQNIRLFSITIYFHQILLPKYLLQWNWLYSNIPPFQEYPTELFENLYIL